MRIRLVRIADRGVKNKERLVLNLTGDVSLNTFMVYETRYEKTSKVRGGGRRAFWFGPLKAKRGDRLVLYTKSGENFERANDDGTMTYFFYWGLPEPIWADENACVVVFEVRDWESIPEPP